MQRTLLTTADETILKQFTIFPYLTGEQLTRLCYSRGSARYVSAKLKTLTYEKFLHRLERETINFPYVYCLGIRGRRYLKAVGYDIPTFYPSEHTNYKPQFMNHTLAVNDFLIAASLLPSSTPDIAVREIRHDLTLKRTSQPVIPDGWIDFRINEHTQVCIWLEMDMGTMDQKPFRKKVAALIEYAQSEYAQVFGTPSLTIAFTTPKGHHRMQTIHTWIQQELTIRHAAQSADVFRILCIPEKHLCPEQIFLSPICVRPFDTDVFPLIEQ
jgi:Replication-relaxation